MALMLISTNYGCREWLPVRHRYQHWQLVYMEVAIEAVMKMKAVLASFPFKLVAILRVKAKSGWRGMFKRYAPPTQVERGPSNGP